MSRDAAARGGNAEAADTATAARRGVDAAEAPLLPVQFCCFAVLHVAGVLSFVAPAANVFFAPLGSRDSGGRLGAHLVPSTMLEAFVESCPVASGITGASFAWSWLTARPPSEAFPGAESPWLCGAAHAAIMLQLQAALLAGVSILALAAPGLGLVAANVRPLLLLWTMAGSLTCWCSWQAPAVGAWGVSKHLRSAAASVQVFVAVGSAALYLHLRFCPQGCDGPIGFRADSAHGVAARGYAGAGHADEVAPVMASRSTSQWAQSFFFQTSKEIQAEQNFTDQLQAMFDSREESIRAARAKQRPTHNAGARRSGGGRGHGLHR
mmetsp:Transcript_15499/g.42645  ORF Transcript_15499/g.42645 Transcript_15499/m.42645 type:complete len:323 (-) Transcript_15499:75-1043(-)